MKLMRSGEEYAEHAEPAVLVFVVVERDGLEDELELSKVVGLVVIELLKHRPSVAKA